MTSDEAHHIVSIKTPYGIIKDQLLMSHVLTS